MGHLKHSLLMACLLILPSCAQGIGATSAAIQTNAKFNLFFLEDVRQSIIMAERSNDKLALLCWQYLEEFAVENAPDPDVPRGKIVGVLSSYQTARNVRRGIIEVKISDDFRIRCGPMLTDSAGALGRLGVSLPLPVPG